jgi:hypothetical protein
LRDIARPAPWLQLVEALRVALAAHDVRARAHAARNDAEVALARAHRALARDQHVGAVVVLARDVVVVAVHRHGAGRERRDPRAAARRLEHRAHHQLAVRERIALRPLDRLDVVVEVLAALAQIGEIGVGQVDARALHVLARERDEIAADPVADAARSRCAAGTTRAPPRRGTPR